MEGDFADAATLAGDPPYLESAIDQKDLSLETLQQTTNPPGFLQPLPPSQHKPPRQPDGQHKWPNPGRLSNPIPWTGNPPRPLPPPGCGNTGGPASKPEHASTPTSSFRPPPRRQLAGPAPQHHPRDHQHDHCLPKEHGPGSPTHLHAVCVLRLLQQPLLPAQAHSTVQQPTGTLPKHPLEHLMMDDFFKKSWTQPPNASGLPCPTSYLCWASSNTPPLQCQQDIASWLPSTSWPTPSQSLGSTSTATPTSSKPSATSRF